MTEETKTRVEEFQIAGDKLVGKLREMLHEGNIRRVAIQNEEGKILIDVPLYVGVVGALLAPQLAAIGAIAALGLHVPNSQAPSGAPPTGRAVQWRTVGA